MDATNSLNTEPAERVLVIERVFDAPRSLVFKAWTEPEHMVQWFGPRGFTSTILQSELRSGGAYRIHMRGPEGDDHCHDADVEHHQADKGVEEADGNVFTPLLS